QERNPIKRWAKKLAVKRFEKFCRNAVAEADLVFSHNAAVVERFNDVWNERCHTFDRSFVRDETLISPDELRQLQQRLREGGALKLVVAGRQILIKATDHVLRAMKSARDHGTQLERIVMGDGD